MKDDELRIKICEITGWVPPPPLSTLCGWMDSDTRMLSDPLSDLTACAEFEKTLSGDQTQSYTDALSLMCGNAARAILATARQRCLAFVKVMEEKK